MSEKLFYNVNWLWLFFSFSGHGLDPLNNGDSDPSDVPVQLTLDPPAGSNIAPGQTVTVSLDVKDPEKTFRGFIIQARDVADR